MKWDFSISQRAADRIQDDQQWAAHQRLLNQARARGDQHERADAGRPSSTVSWVGRLRKKLAGVVAGVSAVLVLTLFAQAGASSLVEIARNLAENVLGQGSVKVIRTADDGHTVLIRWEAATFRPYRTVEETRELLHWEALLATGVVMGRLSDVVRVRFTIVRGAGILATGENRRGQGLRLGFAQELGGGFYQAPEAENSESSTPRRGKPSAAR